VASIAPGPFALDYIGKGDGPQALLIAVAGAMANR